MNGGRWPLLAALIAFLAVIGAYVALKLHHLDTGELLTVTTVLITGLGLGGLHQASQTDLAQGVSDVKATTAKIDAQTNGVLDQRIQTGTTAAVTSVLAAHGIIPTPLDPLTSAAPAADAPASPAAPVTP